MLKGGGSKYSQAKENLHRTISLNPYKNNEISNQPTSNLIQLSCKAKIRVDNQPTDLKKKKKSFKLNQVQIKFQINVLNQTQIWNPSRQA